MSTSEAEADLGSRIRDLLAAPTPTIDTQPTLDGDSDTPDDEIVEALRRQVEVLKGTATALLVLARTVITQADGLQAELDLFGTPPAETVSTPVTPRVEIQRTSTGALVEASLPEDKRLPGFCMHDDALIVDTADGKVRVCPDCEES
jgi:hypothetical protein